jgi:hypothetical protein
LLITMSVALWQWVWPVFILVQSSMTYHHDLMSCHTESRMGG